VKVQTSTQHNTKSFAESVESGDQDDPKNRRTNENRTNNVTNSILIQHHAS